MPDQGNRTNRLAVRLADHARSQPDVVAFRFVKRPGAAASELTWAELWSNAAKTAEGLHTAGHAGKRIAIACEAPLDFVVGLAACFISGSIAVPAPVSLSRRSAPRANAILRTAEPAAILTSSGSAVRDWLADVDDQAGFVEVARSAAMLPADEVALRPSHGDDPALIQFTSGSTGQPRGIALSHANLAANCRAIANAYGLTRDTRGLSWLPLHHDMGLIGHVLVPFWLGCRSTLMDPLRFLQRPLSWPSLVEQELATITSAPNFAYEICARAAEAGSETLDLSSLTTAVCGGESVLPQTIRRFIAAFEPAGFRPAAFAPSYGLAEATLLVASGRTETGPRFTTLSTDDDHAAREITDLGTPVSGLSCRVLDEDGAEIAEGEVGEIEISGDSVGRILGEPAGIPLRTGDLGFLREGRLCVTGRKKELIILRGQNIYPSDIEAAAMDAHPAIAPAGVAAVGVDADGTQKLVVAVEVDRRSLTSPDELRRLKQMVSERVSQAGFVPDDVVVLAFGALPRTSSGKIRRGALADGLLSGTIEDIGTMLAENATENV